MSSVRKFIQGVANHFGYQIRRRDLPLAAGIPVRVVSPRVAVPWRQIAEDVLAFLERVPLLYSDTVPLPLRVGGAWRETLIARRPQQLAAITQRDANALAALFERMFFNELCLGLQDYSYFDGQSLADPSFIDSLCRFEFVTGISRQAIATEPRMPLWGIEVSDRIVKYTDPSHAMQALTAIRLVDGENPVIVDLGSGFGGMAEKLACLYGRPLDIWLVDIPANLMTAYAYLCAMFGREAVRLFSDRDDVGAVGPNDGTRQRFLLAPSLFVQALPPELDVVQNTGSLSEMDLVTVQFYLETLVPRAAWFAETNSNRSSVNWGHVEVRSSNFPVPPTHQLVTRYIPFDSAGSSFRYLTSIYRRR